MVTMDVDESSLPADSLPKLDSLGWGLVATQDSVCIQQNVKWTEYNCTLACNINILVIIIR